MGKFNIGDRVSLPEGTHGPPVEWLGKIGMILELVTTSSGSERLGQERPFSWEQSYRVQWDDISQPVWVNESWLALVERNEKPET